MHEHPAHNQRIDAVAADVPTQRERDELLRGLSQPLPEIAPRYFYDARGSELFDAITATPEYYQTRTEERILADHADMIAALTCAQEVAEIGSGVGKKVRLLLNALRRRGTLQRCALLDISPNVLAESVATLASDFPGLDVRGIVGDFHRHLDRFGPGGDRLVLFLAGTIGNLAPAKATRLLAKVRTVMAPGDRMLLGVDLVKDPDILERAYNDAQGVTGAFNRNALRVVNRRFGANFDPEQWRHVAFYSEAHQRIEMRLEATGTITIHVASIGWQHRFAIGDQLRTEISCKYTKTSLNEVLHGTDLDLERWLTDPDEQFAVAVLRAATERTVV